MYNTIIIEQNIMESKCMQLISKVDWHDIGNLSAS